MRADLIKTPFERMSASNLRLKLIKVGAVIIRNTRRIRVLISDAYPYKDELSDLVRQPGSGIEAQPRPNSLAERGGACPNSRN